MFYSVRENYLYKYCIWHQNLIKQDQIQFLFDISLSFTLFFSLCNCLLFFNLAKHCLILSLEFHCYKLLLIQAMYIHIFLIKIWEMLCPQQIIGDNLQLVLIWIYSLSFFFFFFFCPLITNNNNLTFRICIDVIEFAPRFSRSRTVMIL